MLVVAVLHFNGQVLAGPIDRFCGNMIRPTGKTAELHVYVHPITGVTQIRCNREARQISLSLAQNQGNVVSLFDVIANHELVFAGGAALGTKHDVPLLVGLLELILVGWNILLDEVPYGLRVFFVFLCLFFDDSATQSTAAAVVVGKRTGVDWGLLRLTIGSKLDVVYLFLLFFAFYADERPAPSRYIAQASACSPKRLASRQPVSPASLGFELVRETWQSLRASIEK